MKKSLVQVIAPMLSVNEPEAQVVKIFVGIGRKVGAGDPLCVLETTKATIEVEAEVDGYIYSVLLTKGQHVSAGAVLFEMSSEPPTEPLAVSPVASVAKSDAEPSLPEGLLITKKGLRLAKELGVGLDALPLGVMVTETMVRELSAKAVRSAFADQQDSLSDIRPLFDANKLVIYGAGGHAKTIVDLVRQANHYQMVGIVADPPPVVSDISGVPTLGGQDVLESVYEKGCRLMINAVGATSRNRMRLEIFVRMAKRGFAFPRIVHPKAVVEPSAELAAGVQVFGMALVGSSVRVGFGAIINTGAIVSHDCKIGDLAHLTPGVVLAGGVEVGTGALIGMGVTTALEVKIGEWARVGNGARINGDVPPHAVVQAGNTWP